MRMIKRYNLVLKGWEVGYFVGTRFYIKMFIKE